MRISSTLVCLAGVLFGLAYASGWTIPAGLVWSPVMFWLAACGTDMAYTVRHRQFLLKHEQSPVLRILTGRLCIRHAVPAALATEAALVIFSPFLVTHGWNPEFLGVAAVLTGVIHLSGFAESRSFVRRMGAGPAEQNQGLIRP